MTREQGRSCKDQDASNFSEKLLRWHNRSGRRQLPWQKNQTPYRVWVSEVMLQQTQTAQVVDYFNAFMRRFPSLKKLANAGSDEVLQQWAGLGYYHRAHRLHASAKIIYNQHHGRFPGELADWLALPGVGRSTAGAILSLAYNKRHPILDGNAKRVIARYFNIAGWSGHPRVARRLWQKAEALTPKHRVSDYTQAIMDLGATVCTPVKAQCAVCPVRNSCQARQKNTVSRRPTPAPDKKEKLVCKFLMLFIQRQRKILLKRRPPKGIWAGLLCPPQSDGAKAARKRLQQWGIKQAPVQAARLKHELTHRRLLITPWFVHLPSRFKGRLDPSLNWYKIDPDSMAVPAVVRKCLRQRIG